jgi:hypothetical protein
MDPKRKVEIEFTFSSARDVLDVDEPCNHPVASKVLVSFYSSGNIKIIDTSSSMYTFQIRNVPYETKNLALWNLTTG